jgi:ATP-dependent protease ClpP protease subunit
MSQTNLETKIREGLIQRRSIILVDKITTGSIGLLTQQLLSLQTESNEDIYLIIRSGGGSISAALEFCDWMNHFVTAKVIGIAVGECNSAATFIMANCTEKWSTPFASFVIHSGSISGFSLQMKDDVTEKEVELLLQHTKRISERVVQLYCDKLDFRTSGKKLSAQQQRAKVNELIERGDSRFFSALWAQEACDIGLIDKILTDKVPIFT